MKLHMKFFGRNNNTKQRKDNLRDKLKKRSREYNKEKKLLSRKTSMAELQ